MNLNQLSPVELSLLRDALFARRHALLKEVKNWCKFVRKYPDNPYFYRNELEARGEFARFERFISERFDIYPWHRVLTRDR